MNGLFNSTILDVVIGLVFVYLLLAVICSTLNEWITGWLNVRSSTLKAAITQLLDGQSGKDSSGKENGDLNWFLEKFRTHPLITGLHNPNAIGDKSHPSYLSSRTFATVVMDLVTPDQPGTITFADLETGIQGLPPGDVRKALLAVIQNADHDLAKAQRNIETWYDDSMQRVGGWYKRKVQWITIGIALVLTLAANADTIRMSRVLWRNPTVRSQIVESAKNPPKPGDTTKPHPLSELDDLLGWGGDSTADSHPKEPYQVWLLRALGWILTVIAVSLGAPFWFDLLNKIVNLRSAGNKPETAQQASSPPPPKPQPVAPPPQPVPPVGAAPAAAKS
jgi:hypothetical protein